MIKKCLLDLDGVLTDFVRGAISLHNLPKDIYEKPEALGNWDIVNLSGMQPKEFWSPMGYDFWRNLNWTQDGTLILDLVVLTFGLKNVCLLSAPCATSGCAQGKIDWINEQIPQFKRRYLLGPRKEFCARADHYLIDDRDENVEDFRAHGGNAILVPRPWNKEYKNRHKTFEVLQEKLSKL